MVVPAVLVEMAFVRKTREAGAAGDSNRSVVAELKGAAAAVRKGNGGEPLASCWARSNIASTDFSWEKQSQVWSNIILPLLPPFWVTVSSSSCSLFIELTDPLLFLQSFNHIFETQMIWTTFIYIPWVICLHDCRLTDKNIGSRSAMRKQVFGRNDAKAETPVLWPPHAKSWLIVKDSDAGRDRGQEEKGTIEDEMAGWHHWLDGREFEWTPGVGDGQGGLVCRDSWGRKESDMTERLNWTELANVIEVEKSDNILIRRK